MVVNSLVLPFVFSFSNTTLISENVFIFENKQVVNLHAYYHVFK